MSRQAFTENKDNSGYTYYRDGDQDNNGHYGQYGNYPDQGGQQYQGGNPNNNVIYQNNAGVTNNAPATTPVHTAQNKVDAHHGGSSIATIFCVGIPLLACGLFIYFGMKRVFKQIDESEEKKQPQLNQPLMQDAPGFKQTTVTSNVQKEGRCLKSKHVMPLVDCSPDGEQWHCDICQYTYAAKPGWQFYSCSKCDQDFCPNCFPRVEKTIKQKRVDTLAINDPVTAVSKNRSKTLIQQPEPAKPPAIVKTKSMRAERPTDPLAQDGLPEPKSAAAIQVKDKLKGGAIIAKDKASKALDTVKNNPKVQKALKDAGKKIADQQIKSKVSGFAASIKNKVNKNDQGDLPTNENSFADGMPEVAVYNINETQIGSVASSAKQSLASAREKRRAGTQMQANPNVNQNLPEDQSMTAAYMKNKMIQQENSSNAYDDKLRTTSEYENPYDVSRRGTVAPVQQPMQTIQETNPLQESLVVGSYDHNDPNWQQNQQSVQSKDQYSFASQAEADNYYGQSRDTMKSGGTNGYDETFHQTGNNNAGYGETFHQNNGGQQDYQHQGAQPEYDEEAYYQARAGGTVADLSEYLAQKQQEDVDAGHYPVQQNNKSFEQDEPHPVQAYNSESVAQDVDDYNGQYTQSSNQQSYQDHGNQDSYQQNQESHQQYDNQDGQHYDQNQQHYDQNQESYQQHEGQDNQQQHDGQQQQEYYDQYHQQTSGTFADLNNYLQSNQEAQPEEPEHHEEYQEEQSYAKDRTNTQNDLESFLNQAK